MFKEGTNNSHMRKSFKHLTPREILDLAFSIEKRNEAIYEEWALRMAPFDSAINLLLEDMCAEEKEHARHISDLAMKLFGHSATYINPDNIVEKIEDLNSMAHFFVVSPQDAGRILDAALKMEEDAVVFYKQALLFSDDPVWQQTLTPLAQFEEDHVACILDVKRKYADEDTVCSPVKNNPAFTDPHHNHK